MVIVRVSNIKLDITEAMPEDMRSERDIVAEVGKCKQIKFPYEWFEYTRQ